MKIINLSFLTLGFVMPAGGVSQAKANTPYSYDRKFFCHAGPITNEGTVIRRRYGFFLMFEANKTTGYGTYNTESGSEALECHIAQGACPSGLGEKLAFTCDLFYDSAEKGKKLDGRAYDVIKVCTSQVTYNFSTFKGTLESKLLAPSPLAVECD